jgi:hypothetical protein
MINSNECEEIFEFLRYMNKSEVMKIPIEILSFIKNNRNKNFKTNINKNDLFNLNNLTENALDFLVYIDNVYWKKNLSEINNISDFEDKKENKQNLLVVNSKKSVPKIFEKIKKLFNRKNNTFR